MRFKLTLFPRSFDADGSALDAENLLDAASAEDIVLSCDVTTTVGEVAQALSSAQRDFGPARPAHSRLAHDGAHHGPLTLATWAVGGERLLLDPGTAVGRSGLRSGSNIAVVREFAADARRLRPVAGTIEILGGPERGARFSIVSGPNPIGRDAVNRVRLSDRSVSRRHAVIEAGSELWLRDAGSANGLCIAGRKVREVRITRDTDVTLGAIPLRILPHTPGDGGGREASSQTRPGSLPQPHTRVPRIQPQFAQATRTLPAPPAPPQPARVPVLAMVAPMLMGAAMFWVTRSPMSLMMVAFSPVMMLGSWLDGRLGGRRRHRGSHRRFVAALATERAELESLRATEISARRAEAPPLEDTLAAIRDSGALLWSRRPDHDDFLSFSFGEATLPSRTQCELPDRGDADGAHWKALRSFAEEFAGIEGVPVTESLSACGCVGIAGTDTQAGESLLRALLLQLAGLHSPTDLAIAACTGHAATAEQWGWLKWLPHVDPVGGPVSVAQLADTEAATLRLVVALEGVLEERSHEHHTTPAVVLIVLDRAISVPLRSRLIALAEKGPIVGIHLIWMSDSAAGIPAACRTSVETWRESSVDGKTAQATVSFVRGQRRIAVTRLERLGPVEATAAARGLAPLEDAAGTPLDESDLPHRAPLRELHPVDLLDGATPILQSWRDSGSLMAEWQPGAPRDAMQLATVVGQGTEHPLRIDLRAHGPHALVGGTTGAGKSEFLQSWVMGLAAHLSPDRLTFLLVDYKGGAAFAECVDIPHTVGLVTDLTPQLVKRALISLRAELRRREQLLAERGAKDLVTMERRSDPAAPPALLIVIDEFAALAREVPEFVDGVLDIAQRGRSLGLHLVMATQRPAGVVTDNLRANTNLRIALRMADAADSRDVLGTADAALFNPDTPGRCAIRIGAGRVAHFQAGYLGGSADLELKEPRVEVRPLQFSEGEPWEFPPATVPREPHRAGASRAGASRASASRDIERVRDALAAAARAGGIAPPARPWLEALPPRLRLADLPETRDVAIGLLDHPEAQCRETATIAFDDTGNLAIFGASGSGKTTALITLAAAASARAATDPVHIYAIDAAGGSLDPLSALPSVGTVSSVSDGELTQRVLRHITETVRERQRRFAAQRVSNLTDYRGAAGADSVGEARTLLLIDGLSEFERAMEQTRSWDSARAQLAEIMRSGRAVGVHVVLTADRAAALTSDLAASVQQRLALRPSGAGDYAAIDVRTDILAGAPPGRGILAGSSQELQLAFLGETPDLASQEAGIRRLAQALSRLELSAPAAVRNAPKRVSAHALPPAVDGRPVYGIDTRSLAGVGMPTTGLGVVAGPSGAGLSTATRSCVRAVERWAAARGESVERILLTFARERWEPKAGPAAWAAPGLPADDAAGRGEAEAEAAAQSADIAWDRVAHGVEAVSGFSRALIEALGGRAPREPPRLVGSVGGGSEAPPRVHEGERLAAAGEPTRSPLGAATRRIIVVECPAQAEDTVALPLLVALAKTARHAPALVLFEYETGTGGAVWDLLTALKQPTWGLSLQPDEGEGQTPFREPLGRVTRADFPPGRGYAIERGRTVPVQVALP